MRLCERVGGLYTKKWGLQDATICQVKLLTRNIYVSKLLKNIIKNGIEILLNIRINFIHPHFLTNKRRNQR